MMGAIEGKSLKIVVTGFVWAHLKEREKRRILRKGYGVKYQL